MFKTLFFKISAADLIRVLVRVYLIIDPLPQRNDLVLLLLLLFQVMMSLDYCFLARSLLLFVPNVLVSNKGAASGADIGTRRAPLLPLDLLDVVLGGVI